MEHYLRLSYPEISGRVTHVFLHPISCPDKFKPDISAEILNCLITGKTVTSPEEICLVFDVNLATQQASVLILSHVLAQKVPNFSRRMIGQLFMACLKDAQENTSLLAYGFDYDQEGFILHDTVPDELTQQIQSATTFQITYVDLIGTKKDI